MAASGSNRIALETAQDDQNWGKIVIELDAERAPGTTANFLSYVDGGFYDGTIFHRVIPNFMIQGGGHGSDGGQKRTGLKPAIQNEAKNGLKNERGTIAMARTGDPHSATSQFFINLKDNAFLDFPGNDGWGYCVFGRVAEGMDVVDKIAAVETRAGRGGGEKSEPVNAPKIVKASRA
jgi:peptidyl-prolyl cis-trans isomerase B (cyclophilin B)